MKFIEIKFVTDNKEEAVKIGNMLLDKKLVSCCQIYPIESHYVWKNERCLTQEFMAVLKTKKRLFKQIEKVIKENHSYEVAEIIANPIVKSSAEFLDWIKENTI